MFGEPPTRSKRALEVIVLTIVIVVGVLVRLQEVGYNFDGDEVFSVRLANNSFRDAVSGALQDRPHPPLYYMMLHLWITKAVAVSETSVRALSILLSALFLVVAYPLLRRLVPVGIALVALAVFALSPFFVYYGPMARPYAVIALVSTTNLYLFLRLVDAPHDRRRLAAWCVSCVLLVYAQYLGAVMIMTELVFAFFWLRSERRAIIAGGALASALIVPWLVLAMAGPVLSGADPLTGINWIGEPGLRTLGAFYLSVFGSVPGIRRVQYSLLLVVLAILGAAYVSRAVKGRHMPATHAFMFAIAVGVPVMVYVLAVWGPKAVFAPRQLMSSAIAFVAIIALCLAALPRWAAAMFSLVLLAWGGTAVPHVLPHNAKPPWRDMAMEIDERYGFAVVAAQEVWVRNPLAYYRRRGAVKPWSAFDDEQRHERFVVVCRPETAYAGTLCSDVESGALRSRSMLAKTWQWNLRRNELRLYEVSSAR